MECKDAKRYIHHYFDGDLSALDTTNLKTHLNQCEECKLQYKQIEQVDAMLQYNMHSTFMRHERSESDVKALTDRIMQSVPLKKPRKSKKRFVQWIYRYPGITAAALFVLVMFASLTASFGQDNNVIISASHDDLQHVQITGSTITIPEGSHLTGDLVVENGIIEIKGAVDGNVTVIDGQLVMASTGYIAGQSKTIDQALDWLWYKITSSVSNLIPEWNTSSTLVSLL